MGFVKLIFKIIAAPVVVFLTITVPMLRFLFCYAEALLNLVSMALVIIGAVTFFENKINGCIILFLAFLASPLGLAAIAERMIDGASSLNYALRDFIVS